VANHAPSLAIRRFARWLKGLSRDQLNELTAVAAWVVCVYFLTAFTLRYKFNEFWKAVQFVLGGFKVAEAQEAPDMCGLVNFASSILATTLCSYEAYAGWGTPKGRGAFAAYARRAARRQIPLLLIITSPTLLSNWFGCKIMRAMSPNGQRVARAAAWGTLGFGFRHGITITTPPGLVAFVIVAGRYLGEKVSSRAVPTLGEFLFDICVPTLIAERTAQFFMRRDLQLYGGVSAERNAANAWGFRKNK
tara:strand:+ start:8037 stop:8780 length:744 start_codon:yes stop_codon:yes gene_type:complete